MVKSSVTWRQESRLRVASLPARPPRQTSLSNRKRGSPSGFSPAALPRRRGRKRRIPLTYDFMSFCTRTGCPLKRDSLRVQTIRGIKYCVRCILENRSPTRKIVRFSPRHIAKAATWDLMKVAVSSDTGLFRRLAEVTEGPVTEGKARRSSEKEDTPRSFNDAYCQKFYRPQAVRFLHFLYMQLVFDCGEVNPGKMCEKMRIRCCANGKHGDACLQGWDSLSWFMTFTMVEDLRLEAYGAQDEERRQCRR